MSSKRDLVEAHGFNRRRLITAFVSGAPGGREVEPVRYGRTLVAGVVLALLIVAGAAVSGFLKPAVPTDWKEQGFVIGKTSGSRFVASRGTLFPVINTTSARLLLASEGSLDVTFVPDDEIAKAPQGTTIGIVGAPDVLPSPSMLQPTAWTSCTNQSLGISTRIDSSAQVSDSPRAAVAVRAHGATWVLTGRRRYQLPATSTSRSTLRALGLDADPVNDVPGRWLDLLPEGDPLGPFQVPGAGRAITTGVPGLTKVGTPFLVDGRPFLLDEAGKLRELTDFAFTMYTSSGPGAQLADPDKPLRLSVADVARLKTDGDPIYPASWPESDVQRYDTPSTPCLLMHASADAAPYTTLATPRQGSSAVPQDDETSSAVTEGHGALVRGATAQMTRAGSVFLVDSTGTRYAVGQPGSEDATITRLGYTSTDVVSVPRPWLVLFRDGPALTVAAAGAPATGSTQ